MRKTLNHLLMLSILLVISGCGATSGSTPPAQTHKAFVRKVHSGDTLTLQAGSSQPIEVRLYGIDAPELGQPYVGRAQRRLSELSTGKEVQFVFADASDAEEDEILLFIDGSLVSTTLLREGLAWVKPGVQDSELSSAYANAKQNKRGLWRDSRQIAPWKFRSLRSAEANKNNQRHKQLTKKEAPSVINYNSIEGMDHMPAYRTGYGYMSRSDAKRHNSDAAKYLNKKYKRWKTCSGGYCYESGVGGSYRRYKAGKNDRSSATPREEE